VELRALDLLCTQPEGISLDEMRFLEAFVLFCLLTESPFLDADEKVECNRNSLNVACCARGKDFMLFQKGRNIPLKHWASVILDQLLPIADILDEEETGQPYRNSIEKHRAAVADPEQTLSAIILNEMRTNRESFTEFALRLSRQHAEHWKKRTIGEDRSGDFALEADLSLQKQAQIESSDRFSLDQYLDRYWAQR
jgi:glutamate--cysteine ligase